MKTFGCCHLLLLSLFNPISTSTYISISSVRALVTKHAFASYFMNEMVNDVVDKPVIIHNIMDLTNPKVNFGFELTTLSIISYLVYKFYYASIYSFYNKFNKLPEFKKYYRKFQFCIFVLTIVLTKEIGNAI
jgi:hypothetical protein